MEVIRLVPRQILASRVMELHTTLRVEVHDFDSAVADRFDRPGGEDGDQLSTWKQGVWARLKANPAFFQQFVDMAVQLYLEFMFPGLSINFGPTEINWFLDDIFNKFDGTRPIDEGLSNLLDCVRVECTAFHLNQVGEDGKTLFDLSAPEGSEISQEIKTTSEELTSMYGLDYWSSLLPTTAPYESTYVVTTRVTFEATDPKPLRDTKFLRVCSEDLRLSNDETLGFAEAIRSLVYGQPDSFTALINARVGDIIKIDEDCPLRLGAPKLFATISDEPGMDYNILNGFLPPKDSGKWYARLVDQVKEGSNHLSTDNQARLFKIFDLIDHELLFEDTCPLSLISVNTRLYRNQKEIVQKIDTDSIVISSMSCYRCGTLHASDQMDWCNLCRKYTCVGLQGGACNGRCACAEKRVEVLPDAKAYYSLLDRLDADDETLDKNAVEAELEMWEQKFRELGI